MIYEMRTYTCKPGKTPEAEERFAKGLPNRVKLSPLGAFWRTEVGTLNQIIHVWPYENAGERDRIRAESRKVEGWPPGLSELLLQQETKILTPALNRASCAPTTARWAKPTSCWSKRWPAWTISRTSCAW